MHQRTTILSLIAPCVLSLAAAASHADTVYNFGSVPSGTVTPTTISGATFSSPSDPGAFTFGPNSGLYSTLGSNVLAGGNVATLDISFATAQTGISFDVATGDIFGSNGGDTFTVTTNTGFTKTVIAAVPTGFFYPEALFSLAGGKPFTFLTISASDAVGNQSVSIGNMTSTPVPLPAAAWLLMSALGGGIGFIRRTRTTS